MTVAFQTECECNEGFFEARSTSKQPVGPIPEGWEEIQRCDLCKKYESDWDAADKNFARAQLIACMDGRGPIIVVDLTSRLLQNPTEAKEKEFPTCPHCGYDGLTEPEHGGTAPFYYLWDVTTYHDVKGLSKTGGGTVLEVEIATTPAPYDWGGDCSALRTGDGYDNELNPCRIECRNCLKTFPEPDGTDITVEFG